MTSNAQANRASFNLSFNLLQSSTTVIITAIAPPIPNLTKTTFSPEPPSNPKLQPVNIATTRKKEEEGREKEKKKIKTGTLPLFLPAAAAKNREASAKKKEKKRSKEKEEKGIERKAKTKKKQVEAK